METTSYYVEIFGLKYPSFVDCWNIKKVTLSDEFKIHVLLP